MSRRGQDFTDKDWNRNRDSSNHGPRHIQVYHTSDQIASGSSGKTILAKGSYDRKVYVAKQMDTASNEATLSYALQEARMLFLLRHPRIVQLHDFYSQSTSIFLVLEYCDGGDLAKQIQDKSRAGGKCFEEETVFKWWYQLLDGLDFCHEQGVLHRDIKPSNLLLDSNSDLKLADFSVAALLEAPPAPERVGSRRYMAPEVVEDLRYSTKSDVWSAGIVMMETMLLKQHAGDDVDLAVFAPQLTRKYGSFAQEGLERQLQRHPEMRSEASEQKNFLLSHIPGGSGNLIESKNSQQFHSNSTSP
eukprot:768035-Hanusia_phi.AAC.4